MNMHHLGPLHNDRNVSLGGNDTANQSSPVPVNPDVSERFGNLQSQVDAIRDPKFTAQTSVYEGENLTTQLTNQNQQQINTVTGLNDLQSSELFTHDDMLTDVDRLRREAQDERDMADHEIDQQLAQWHLDEAKRKEDEANLLEEQARVMNEGIDDRTLDIGEQTITQQTTEVVLGNATSDTYNATRTFDNLSAQSTYLTEQLSGSSPQRTTSSSSGTYLSGSGSALSASNELGASTTLSASGEPGTEQIVAAIQILQEIAKTEGREVSRGITSPIGELAKNLVIKGLSEDAKAILETAQVAAALMSVATNQEIILLMSMANDIHGNAVTNVAFWREVLKDNNKLAQQSQELAKGSLA